MKKKTLLLWLGVVVVILGIILLTPASRYVVMGLAKQEPFDYNGRPLSYWINALQEGDEKVRHQAAKALGNFGREGKEAVPALAVALADQADLVRVNAALALMKMAPDTEAAVPQLGEALRDKYPMIRMDAVIALHRMGAEARGAVPALIKALQDPDNWRPLGSFHMSVAQMAVSSLGRIGPDARAAKEVLAGLLDDGHHSPEARDQILEALAKIDAEESQKQ
jgi:HEAT repeat protein